MKSNLLPKEIYPRLLNMDHDGITHFIEDTQYKQDVDELARTFEGVDLIEHALNRNLAVTFSKLIEISEGELNYIITEYLRDYDIWNIKTILRGKFYDASVDEIRHNIVSGGQFRYHFLSELAEKESYEEIIEVLGNSDYYAVLKNYDGTNLSEIENQLDKLYYQGLLQTIDTSRSNDHKLFSKFIRTEIDIKNITTLFRMKKGGIGGEDIEDLLLDGGYLISPDKLRKMAYLTFEELAASIENYPYREAISDIVSPDMESLVDVETSLTKYIISSTSSFSHVYPLSIVPILDFVLNKKIEVSNLQIIIRGKAANLDEEIMKNQLVI
jgi:V/A-type H+-transporting ATPase subunit C